MTGTPFHSYVLPEPDLREELLLSIGTDALAVIEQYCAENDLSLEFYVEANATKPGGIMDQLGLTLDQVSAQNIAETLRTARQIDSIPHIARDATDFMFRDGRAHG